MFEKRSSSVYDIQHRRKSHEDLLHRRIHFTNRQLTFGIIIGVCLTIITILLQCIAFFTPHWKEISPNTDSLYVDGVDALIRTEVLIYFNSVHRFTRQSYGIFQRCEYILSDSSKFTIKKDELTYCKEQKTCTKNFLPSFQDEKFDQCHSLQYYRFCSKTGEKNFDISNDYLRATFDISSNSALDIDSTSTCNCHYPFYVKTCHVFGIFIIICLLLMVSLFASFPFFKNPRHHLKIKCFGILSSILSILFMLINLIIILSHLEYESTEYLTAIEEHYRSNQIYKLSQDTKIAINQFLSSINIKIGYSTILAWIAFILAIIDGILLMMTCKVKHDYHDVESLFTGISVDSSPLTTKTINEETQPSNIVPTLVKNTVESQDSLSSPPLLPPSPSLLPSLLSSRGVIDNFDKQLRTHSFLSSSVKQSSSPRIYFEDEV